MPAKKKKKVGKKKKIVVTQTSDVGHDGDQSVDLSVEYSESGDSSFVFDPTQSITPRGTNNGDNDSQNKSTP